MAAAVRMKVRTKGEFRKVRKAAKRGTITSLGHAGAYIRGIAKKSIKISPVYAPPGHPPHSRKGRLKHGIVYAVEKQRSAVLIGPTYSAVGKIARTHEFGGTEPPKKLKGRKANWKLEVGGFGPIRVGPAGPEFARLVTERQVARAKEIAATLPQGKGARVVPRRRYPKRPFMGPALMRSKERLPRKWQGSVR